MGKGEPGDAAAQAEEDERGAHEGDGVALLVGVQARGDEAPQLPQQHGQGEDDTTPNGDTEPDAEAVERAGHVQGAALTDRDDVAVRGDEERQDGLVQNEGHHRPGSDGQGGDDDPPAQLGQMAGQGHLRHRRPAQGQPQSHLYWSPAEAAMTCSGVTGGSATLTSDGAGGGTGTNTGWRRERAADRSSSIGSVRPA